jgi:dephospho-CoA kinase
MSSQKILAIVGMSGSGKSEVVNRLTAQGWPRVYFGGMIYAEMERRGIAITPESQQAFREQIRVEQGKDWAVNQVLDETNRLIAAGQKHIVLDGLYSWTEYKVLRKAFESDLIVVAVVVDKHLRHARVATRPDRPFTTEEINLRDWSEIENLEKGGPIAIADYYLPNNGSLAELHEHLDKLAQIVLS